MTAKEFHALAGLIKVRNRHGECRTSITRRRYQDQCAFVIEKFPPGNKIHSLACELLRELNREHLQELKGF